MTRVFRAGPEVAGDSSSATGSRATSPLKNWLFFVLLAVIAIPIAVFDIFPAQDGAAHVGNGAVYVDVGESVLDTYFDVQWLPLVPNVLVDLVLGALLLVFSPFVAERLVVLAMLVGLPLGVRYCLQRLNRGDSVWTSLLAVPLGASFLLYFGFYGFLLGVVLSLFVLGFWLKRVQLSEVTVRTGFALAGMMLLVYASHPLPFLALIVFMAAASFDLWIDRRKAEPEAAGSAGRRQALTIAMASALPLVLLGMYTFEQPSVGAEYGRPFLQRLAILPADALVAYSNWEIPFAALLSGGILLVGLVGYLRSRRSAAARPGFLIATILFAGAYLASPNELGPGGVILPRIVLLMMIAAILWLGTLSFPSWIHAAIVVIAAVTTVGLTSVRMPAQTDVHDQMTEFASGIPVIEEETTVLPLWGDAENDSRTWRIEFPRKTWAGYAMAEKRAVDFSHFPAYVEAFPVEFRPEYDIRAFSPEGEEAFVLGRPLVDAPGYVARSPGEVDYVWIWGGDQGEYGRLESPSSADMAAWLEADYEPIFVSSPRGLLTIYERSQ